MSKFCIVISCMKLTCVFSDNLKRNYGKNRLILQQKKQLYKLLFTVFLNCFFLGKCNRFYRIFAVIKKQQKNPAS